MSLMQILIIKVGVLFVIGAAELLEINDSLQC